MRVCIYASVSVKEQEGLRSESGEQRHTLGVENTKRYYQIFLWLLICWCLGGEPTGDSLKPVNSIQFQF